ncbi:hypothetical protein NOF55_08085 [Rhizobiaceae bacterium BDR2-2]|uniref:Uncharacterized protein n=1 Tax=Ectorhizobium quercum TaxID=2965071 RepID=A0AAE3N0I1_9HYPH|nr:hypothetical protein [Ectorhizobium quercum]MCX8997065.1 hypothetical protein [Ectorhizobium quercum]
MNYMISGRSLALLLVLVSGLASPASAATETGLSKEIGQSGIVATRDRLRAAATLSDGETFALGGLEMLAAVEEALQARWRIGLSEDLAWLPLMRLPIPENPVPEPFDPAVVAESFRKAIAGAASAEASLAQIPDDSSFKLEIDTADLWFDVNANGARDPGENFAQVMGLAWPADIGGMIDPEEEPPVPSIIIRFDLADAHWLKAYSNLIAGIGETILAYDPTEAIGNVVQSRLKFAELGTIRPAGMFDFVGIADMVAILKNALAQQPDAAALARAHRHFLAMVAENRTFWRLAEAETDNDAEWIPNDRQTSALGLEFPQQTAEVWQGVLADAEAVLEGRLLAPYWQLNDFAGINVRRMFLEPRAIDLLNWVQGQDALHYAENGKVMRPTSWRAFESLVMGDALMYAIILN